MLDELLRHLEHSIDINLVIEEARSRRARVSSVMRRTRLPQVADGRPFDHRLVFVLRRKTESISLTIPSQLGRRCVLFAVCLTALVSCSSDRGPTTPSSSVIQVGGGWTIQETLTAVNGGECVADTLRAFGAIGQTNSMPLDITQNGISLIARTTSPEGISCSLTGTAGSTEFVLRGSCGVQALAQCGNGELRMLRYEGADGISMTGRVEGMTLVGTSTERILVSTQSGAALEPLVVSSTFRGTRR